MNPDFIGVGEQHCQSCDCLIQLVDFYQEILIFHLIYDLSAGHTGGLKGDRVEIPKVVLSYLFFTSSGEMVLLLTPNVHGLNHSDQRRYDQLNTFY